MSSHLKIAAFAGILLAILTIPITIIESIKSLNIFFGNLSGIYVPLAIYVIGLITYLLFIMGFVIIGQNTQNMLLRNISYIVMIFSLIDYGYSIVTSAYPYLGNTNNHSLMVILTGVLGVPFGIALLKLKDDFGTIAIGSGIMMFVTSACLFTAGLLTIMINSNFILLLTLTPIVNIFVIMSILSLIATYILETILLFKASDAFY